MEEVEYRKTCEYEDEHWWFRGKRAIVGKMITRFGSSGTERRILDVGCGTGGLLRALAEYGEAHGIDVHPLALDLCRQRGSRNLVRGAAVHLPYGDDEFDVVTALDVLYHRRVMDVGAVVRELYRVCRPGGVCVVTDSAFEALRGAHDRAYHGARRFRRGEVARHMESSGFAVVKSSYMNSLLFPIGLAVRLLDKVRFAGSERHSSLGRVPAGVNAVLGRIYRLEARVLEHASLPFGLSVLVVGRKPGSRSGEAVGEGRRPQGEGEGVRERGGRRAAWG